MKANNRNWNFIDYIQAFFPLQLLFAHLKYNLFAIFFWSVLFLIANDSLGYAFGVPLLFLSPEYLGEVSGWSFFLLGFSLGGFIMGFNTFSYMKLGPHFPFLTTLAKPFLKFCINNSLIPIVFTIVFISRIFEFQLYEELAPLKSIFFYVFNFCLGIAIFLTLSFLYFFRVGKKTEESGADQIQKPISSVMHKREKWFERFRKNADRPSLYFSSWKKLVHSRSSKHFDQKLVEQVFAQNKINASVFELTTISIFFVLGAFNAYELFEVPAAVSIVLLLTIFLMLFSALHSWFKGWVYPLFIIVIFGMNYLSTRTGMFKYTNFAYGLNYNLSEKDEYSIDRIDQISSNTDLRTHAAESYIETLNAWKENTHEKKPKLIIINTSGGGSRSALWTMTVLQNADQQLNGKLADHIQLITGASGGMIGAAYFRELLLRKRKGEIKNLYDPQYSKNMSKDMLNKLSFMASTNDIFIRYQKYTYNKQEYTKDRGYAFEEQLHENTNNVLRHNLGYYEHYERTGMIPTMIFSPTIVNDGRRMLIASQRIDFITEPTWYSNGLSSSDENIEFHSLLSHQKTGEIRFSSVLRSSATFPFVMPMVTLPTEPEIQLMDAGIRDNYGTKTMMEFLFSMKDWIRENTSGVIVLQIRDTQKVLDNETYKRVSFIDKITLPFGNMYKNFPRVQDFNQEELISLGAQSLEFPIDLISFNLREKKEDRISLSWHLTKQEKERIKNAFKSKKNQNALAQLKRIL